MAKLPFILGTDKLGVNADDPWVEVAVDSLSISDPKSVEPTVIKTDILKGTTERILQIYVVRLETFSGSDTAVKDVSLVRIDNTGNLSKPEKEVTRTVLDALNSIDVVSKDALVNRLDVLDTVEVVNKFVDLVRHDNLFANQFVRFIDFVFDPERLFIKVDRMIYYLMDVDTLPPIVVDVKDNVIFQNYRPTEVRFKLYDENGTLVLDKIGYYSEGSKLLTYILDSPLSEGTYYGRFVVTFETGDVMTVPSYGDGIVIFVG